jgi:hypothetical protein
VLELMLMRPNLSEIVRKGGAWARPWGFICQAKRKAKRWRGGERQKRRIATGKCRGLVKSIMERIPCSRCLTPKALIAIEGMSMME